MKLGKLPARYNSIKFKLSSYIDAAYLPQAPQRFGHYGAVKIPWGELGNNRWGDCVWAGAGHETMIWCASAGKPVPAFSDQEILSSYHDVTGFDFTDETDYGTDMQQAASYRQKTGITDGTNRYKVDSYVALRVGDPDQLALATYIFGVVGVGIIYPRSAEHQFKASQPWDYVGRSPSDGGHYIPCVGRNSKGNFVVITWGRLQAMTPRFYQEYSDEAVAYISLDALNNRLITPEGLNITMLRRDLAEI